MRKQKLLACLLAGVMVLSMAACGEEETSTSQETSASTETSVETVVETPAYEYDSTASITFDDGNYAFLGSDSKVNPAAKETLFSLVDRNGQKAVKVESADAGKLYAAVQMDALLGDKIGEVASVEFGIETEVGDSFKACSGNIYAYLGEDETVQNTAWSIYLEKGNPKTVSMSFNQAAVEGNIVVLTLEVNGGDSNTFDAALPTAMYIYTISFKDANGNVLAADSTAEYVVANDNGPDRSNLFECSSYVDLGIATSGDAWAQNGIEITEDVLAQLVPGTLLEIEYSSEDGDIWVVMPWAEAGWMRCAQNDAYINDSHNIAQVTYEQIAAMCGEDTSTWGLCIQCEGSSAWEVYSVKIGTKGTAQQFVADYTFDGFAVTGDAWAQNGVEITEDILANFVPGSVLRFQYTSESGNLWCVMPWATAGWMRVGQAGTGDDAVCEDGYCYVTYEQIEALCGEDVSTWGLCVQAESDSAWEVYSAEIGHYEDAANKEFKSSYTFDNFAVTGDAWAQNGVEITEDVLAMFVPGTVLKLQYTSESGNLWVVMPWATAGWMRVGQAGTGDDAVCDGSVCYVTYEQIAALCGDDTSTWGLCIQAESDSAWEVYSVELGTLEDAASAPALHGLKTLDGFAKTGDAWAQDGIEITEDQLALLVPGSVVKFQYTSESGNLWLVMPWATAGWMRVGQAGSGDDAICTGSTCYVTYEQIEALCGEDTSTWGLCMQAESDSAWEVYSVQIGMTE